MNTFVRLLSIFFIFVLSGCSGSGSSKLIDKLFGGGLSPILTSIQDQTISQTETLKVDVNNILDGTPGSDEKMSYSCHFDNSTDGVVTDEKLCSEIPNSTVTFNSATGELLWTPLSGILGNYEVKITGRNDGGTYDEIFTVGVRLKFGGIGLYTSISGTSVTMTWTPNTSAVAYQVFKLNTLTGQYELFKTVNDPNASGTVLTGLTPNTGYTFRTQALDNLGFLDGNVVSRSVTTTELVRLSMSTPSANVVAGAAVPITVQAFNADGSPQTVGGLPVNVNISAGTSLGTFSPVVDNNDGTYSTVFTPTIVGTALTIEASINISYFLMNAVNLNIAPGAPVSANSSLTIASSTVVSGNPVLVTAVLKDAYSNLISDATVNFLKSGGTSTGTFGATVNAGAGVYTTTYSGVTAGTAQTLRVEANGTILAMQTSISVLAGPASSVTSTLTISQSSISSGTAATITATLKDANSNLISTGVFVSFDKTGGTSTGNLSAVTNAGGGIYTATYTGISAGTAQTISVSADGVPLTPTVTVAVVPAAPAMANSLLEITSNTVASGQFVTITATLKDLNNNPVTSGHTIAFTKTGGSSSGTFNSVSNQGGGVYTIRYTGVTAGTAQSIAVTVDGVSLGLTETISVTPGSPSPATSTISTSLASVSAGQSATITGTLRDSNNNLISSGYTVSFSKFGGTATGVLGSSTNVGSGTYTTSYQGQGAGSAQTIQLVVDGLPLGPSTSVAVTPGAPDNLLTTFTVSSTSVVAGSTVTLTIELKDSYGNAISSGYVVGVQTLGGSSSGNISAVANSGGGIYTANFQGTTAGSPLVFQATANAAGLGPNRSIQVLVGPPHATYSTITATPSPVVSGSVSTIEAVVKDAYNNRINSEYAITFDATLGTSSGTLQNQTNPTSGVHRIEYEAIGAGSAQTLRVLANGAPVSGLTTTLQVVAGPVEVSNSSFSISSNILQSGTSANLTMSFRDANNNPINNATVTFNKTTGVSDGTLSSPATFSSNGNYTATYTGLIQGAAQSIHPVVNGVAQPSLNVNVTVIAGPPTQFAFSGTTTGLTAIDCHGPFTVTLKDSEGNITASATAIEVALNSVTPGAFDGRLFSDSSCTTSITKLDFPSTVTNKSFYLKSYLPMTSNLEIAPPAGISSQTVTFAITPVNSILGSSAVGTLLGSLSQFIAADASSGFVEPYTAMVYGDFLYVADLSGNRILKFNHTTQTFVGWLGHIGDLTGISAGCSSASLNDLTPTWCTGGRAQTIGTPAILRTPRGLASDGTFLYVSTGTHQILRFDLSSGAYMGWIGRISTTAATSPASCVLAGTNALTPTWCFGGTVNSSTADASFSSPSEMTIVGTKLYIADTGNHRLQKWDLDGTYEGWMGRIGATAATSPASCVSAGTQATTPTWCKGGVPVSSNRRGLPNFDQPLAGNPVEGFNNPRGLTNDGTYLYIGDASNKRVVRIKLSNDQFEGWIGRLHQGTGSGGLYANSLAITTTGGNLYPSNWITGGGSYESSSATGFGEAYSLWYDISSASLYIADASYNRIVRVDASNGQNPEWVGRISTSPTGGSPGCSATPSMSVTPGWCRGGASNVRGNGNLSFNGSYGITGTSTHIYAVDKGNYRIQKINKSTGQFESWLGTQISTASQWSRLSTGVPSHSGFDNYSFGDVATANTWNGIALSESFLFVTDTGWHRIKKHTKETGAIQGYIGILDGNVSSGASVGGFPPTGPDSCFGITTGMTPDWCTGGGRTTSGSGVHGYNNPRAVAATTSTLFIANMSNNRIDRVRISDALYQGWTGMVSTSPTDGDLGCNGAATNSVNLGWCIGGTAKATGDNGSFDSPRGLYYDTTDNKLYVTDLRKVARVNPSNGATEAVIGHISTAGSGCTIVGQGASGWCGNGAVAGTGSNYYGAVSDPLGVVTDSTYLYVTDTGTQRILRFLKSTGEPAGFIGKMSNNTRINTGNADACNGLTAGYPRVTPGWCTGQTTGVINTQAGAEDNAFNSPRGIWTDGTYLYVADTSNNRIVRINASTGAPEGWKGEIASTAGMSDQDCIDAGVGGITPKWCTGGSSRASMQVGGFTFPSGITGDTNYLYVTDSRNNRIATVPKN